MSYRTQMAPKVLPSPLQRYNLALSFEEKNDSAKLCPCVTGTART